MSDRPTPETDKAERMAYAQEHMVPTEVARRLERERDEWYYKAHANAAFTLEARAERDEAREKAERYRLEANALMLKVMEGAK